MTPEQKTALIYYLQSQKSEVNEWLNYLLETPAADDRTYRLRRDAEDELAYIDAALEALDAPLTAEERAELVELLDESPHDDQDEPP